MKSGLAINPLLLPAEIAQDDQEYDRADEGSNDLADKPKVHSGEQAPNIATSQSSQDAHNDLS